MGASSDRDISVNDQSKISPLVTIIIPALNEEQTLGIVLQRVHTILRQMDIDYEIIVVDDGSSDGTGKVADDNNAILIKHSENRGKGVALSTGFSKARGDIIVTMDADGSHLAEDIPNLIDPLRFDNKVDVIIGTRFYNGIDRDSTSHLHLIGNAILNSTIHILTGVQIHDSQCGFRAFRRKVVDGLIIDCSGFEVEGEMIVRIILNNIPFGEVPVRCLPRRNGVSRVRTFQDGYKIFKTIITIMRNPKRRNFRETSLQNIKNFDKN